MEEACQIRLFKKNSHRNKIPRSPHGAFSATAFPPYVIFIKDSPTSGRENRRGEGAEHRAVIPEAFEKLWVRLGCKCPKYYISKQTMSIRCHVFKRMCVLGPAPVFQKKATGVGDDPYRYCQCNFKSGDFCSASLQIVVPAYQLPVSQSLKRFRSLKSQPKPRRVNSATSVTLDVSNSKMIVPGHRSAEEDCTPSCPE